MIRITQIARMTSVGRVFCHLEMEEMKARNQFAKYIADYYTTRILRRALSKGKAYEGKKRYFEAKRSHLSRFLVIFQEKTTVL